MSRSRPRTGLRKPREVEKELLEARWRERQAELRTLPPEVTPDIRALIDQERTAHHAMNSVAKTLWELSVEFPEASFRAALDDLQRLGLTGPELNKCLDDRHRAFMDADEACSAARALATVDRLVAEGSSLERALEHAAAEQLVVGNSLDAAVQRVKRWYYGRGRA